MGTIEFAAKAGKIAWTSDECCIKFFTRVATVDMVLWKDTRIVPQL